MIQLDILFLSQATISIAPVKCTFQGIHSRMKTGILKDKTPPMMINTNAPSVD